ncbi:hypothetical protein [Synechococcus sp. PCC 7336]|uniref:hypothetical protein n=1 Tax=Synechococcus sp. PCC 7336 TaxID=195250 RepID=UPI000348C4EE|nr:hypothetical protein [Synechococcus sp. PCC 7336]
MLSSEAKQLFRLVERVRWAIVGLFWLAIGLPSLWSLRVEVGRLLEFFTWGGLKYSLIFRPWPAFGLVICIGITLSTLLWQSYYELFGLSSRTRRELEQQVAVVRQEGPSHFLWRWIFEPSGKMGRD